MRLMVALLVGGIFMLIYGCNTKRVNKGVSKPAQKITFQELVEKGVEPLENKFIQIKDKHTKFYEMMVFDKTIKQNTYQKKANAFPDLGTVYYPAVSSDHMMLKEINKSYKKADINVERFKRKKDNRDFNADSLTNVFYKTFKLKFPELKDFKVLIKDSDMGTIKQRKMFAEEVSYTKGIVIPNDLLSSNDRERIANKFPSINIDDLIIIDTSIKPANASFFWTLIILGIASIGYSTFEIFKMLKPDKTKDVFEDDDALTAYAKKRNPHLFD